MLNFNSDKLLHDFEHATGLIGVTLMNDMMFHRVMQHSNASLKALVCSLKGFPQDSVLDVILTNQIDYSIASQKEVVLDVKTRISTGELMNIELQVYRDRDWIKRSLFYLCRSYDSIDQGMPYAMLRPAEHVCITNQNLFPEHPEFFGEFVLFNPEKNYAYSSQLAIHVLELGLTELATPKNIANGLVSWAELFKAQTWEEVHRIIRAFPPAQEVAKIMYAVNMIPQEKTIMEAHERYMNVLYSQQEEIKEQQAALVDANHRADDSDRRAENYRKLLIEHGIDPDSAINS